MRIRTAVVFDIRFQWRHGFYGVYLIVCAFYVVLLHFIPEEYQEISTVAFSLGILLTSCCPLVL